MARALHQAGWDVVAYNFRGCSGEPNRSSRTYHSGATDDLRLVLDHVLSGYDRTALVGFSLGGNLVLKYLGEEGASATIAGAVAISAPVDLADACARICSPSNRLYHYRFMRKLRRKILAKADVYPGTVDPDPLERIGNLIEFDDAYTAPMHGFRDAADYYARCSSLGGLPNIQVPTLLLTAANDPLLGERCYPREAARNSSHLHLEVADHGGHAGWYVGGGTYYSEAHAAEFLEKHK
jgi:predicted alpha/beta-fold hydrolase